MGFVHANHTAVLCLCKCLCCHDICLQVTDCYAVDCFLKMESGSAGMAGVLGLLKERGELNQRMQWAGRTNDMKPVMLQGLEEVYQSGGHTDQIANRVEMALTRRDEYGLVLTTKLGFREVSYR